MKQNKGLQARELIRKAVCFTVVAGIFLCMTGCSKQFARLEENQAQLHSVVQSNSIKLEAITDYIEQNKIELTAEIQQVQNETKAVADNVSVVDQKIMNNLAGIAKNQEALKTGLVASYNETAKVANNVIEIDQKQSELHNTIKSNDGKMTERVARLEQGQNNLKAGIEDSRNQTLKVASDVATLSQEQVTLHETTQNDIRQVAGDLSKVARNQEVLKTGLVVSHNETAKVANNVIEIDQKQSELHNTIKSNDGKMTERVARLEQGQNNLKAGIEDSKNQTLKVSSEVAALGQEQASLYEATQNDIRQVAGNISNVARNQEVLKTGLVVSYNETAKVANNVIEIDQKQSELHNTIKSNDGKMTERVARLEQGQNNLKAGIEDSKNQTLKVASDVATLSQEQAALHKTTQNDIRQVAGNISKVTQNQEVLKTGLVVSHNETARIANNVYTLANEQAKLYETSEDRIMQIAEFLSKVAQSQEILKTGLVVSHNETAKVARNQEVLKTGLVVSHNETAKVANNVAALGQKQTELTGIIQNDNNRLSEKVAALEQKQYDLQTGIENIHDQTKEIASNISAVGDGQVSLQGVVDTYNQQITERVTVVEQGQQEWQATINQMQISIQEASGNISTFEKSLIKLQEIFQSNMNDLVAAANTKSQGQNQFQEKMKKDLLSLADSINLIKQNQSGLQKEIELVQSSTEALTIELPAAIEQLREEMADEATAYSIDE